MADEHAEKVDSAEAEKAESEEVAIKCPQPNCNSIRFIRLMRTEGGLSQHKCLECGFIRVMNIGGSVDI